MSDIRSTLSSVALSVGNFVVVTFYAENQSDYLFIIYSSLKLFINFIEHIESSSSTSSSN